MKKPLSLNRIARIAIASLFFVPPPVMAAAAGELAANNSRTVLATKQSVEDISSKVESDKKKLQTSLDALDQETVTAEDIYLALCATYTNIYAVTYKDDIGNGTHAKRVRDGLCVKQPQDPSAYAYIFDGWFENGATNSFDFANTPITNDVTLAAKWTPAVAAVYEAGSDATNLCATLAEAFDQAATSYTPATVTILRDATLPMNETAIHGSGSNDTFITIHNDKTVTIGRPNFTGAFEITGATVVFEGSGSWIDTRTSGSDHSRFCIGADDYPSAGAHTGDPANVIVNGGTFEMGNLIAHLWNVAYGTLTFNGGTIKSGYARGAAKYCVRAEVQGHVVINGGTFEGANTKQPVLAKDSGTVSITGLNETKFAVKDGNESYVTPMASYLADGYEFKLNEDGYYRVQETSEASSTDNTDESAN